MIKTISSLHWLSRLLIFALALMLIIGAGFPTPTRAQSDAETVWYWATTPEGLVAYTLDGEINLVLPSNELAGVSFSARPLTETLTLLTSKTISYLMTPDEVINTFTAQQYPYLYYGGTGETYSRPYLIIWSEEPTRWVRILNTETGESQELNGGALGLRLLSDGQPYAM
ncbi:MAG: hypothetical protein F9K46_06135 [Anaerolineae bacterium]|nr:MAG: hypothetical protein F9K46_06135 [Anaerolineae bacterium]